MPAYRPIKITQNARGAALRALDAAPASTPFRPPVPLSAVELREIDIIDDALDHHLAPQLPR